MVHPRDTYRIDVGYPWNILRGTVAEMTLLMIIFWPEKENNKIMTTKMENGREQFRGMDVGITDELQWGELHQPLATRGKGHGCSQWRRQGDLTHNEE